MGWFFPSRSHSGFLDAVDPSPSWHESRDGLKFHDYGSLSVVSMNLSLTRILMDNEFLLGENFLCS